MKVLDVLNEGTWSSPNTVDKALALHKLMQRPIPANKASDLLYDLIGDDDLFDSIHEIETQDDPTDDARHVIQHHIQKMIRNFDPNDWKSEWDADSIRILQDI